MKNFNFSKEIIEETEREIFIGQGVLNIVRIFEKFKKYQKIMLVSLNLTGKCGLIESPYSLFKELFKVVEKNLNFSLKEKPLRRFSRKQLCELIAFDNIVNNNIDYDLLKQLIEYDFSLRLQKELINIELSKNPLFVFKLFSMRGTDKIMFYMNGKIVLNDKIIEDSTNFSKEWKQTFK